MAAVPIMFNNATVRAHSCKIRKRVKCAKDCDSHCCVVACLNAADGFYINDHQKQHTAEVRWPNESTEETTTTSSACADCGRNSAASFVIHGMGDMSQETSTGQ